MRRTPYIILLAVLGIFGFILLLGDSGYLAYRATLLKHEDLVKELNRLKQENMRMVKEIKSLTDDPEFQEYVLRKEMNLVRPNEILLTFERGSVNVRKD